MIHDFLIFYAPFLVLLGAIIAAFWIALKDGQIEEK
jgi:hypothetical protein